MARMLLRIIISQALVLLVVVQSPRSSVRALENNLARTPPMGWLAWERFTCEIDCQLYPNECINSRLFKRMADRLAEDGWLAAGYEYLNIDDCWSEKTREPSSERLVPDKRRFPPNEGDIEEIARYVHKYDGMKLGIYGDCGSRTCGGYPGQLRHHNATHEHQDYRTATYFQVDARTFASWQVDSLKFDGCYVDPLKAERICSRMANALAETKRPIMLVCEWPFYMMYAHAEPDWELTMASCNVWRYYDDIEDSWLSILNTIDHTVRHQSTMVKYHGPGHWFDPDQLVIGNFGLSVAQARAQMALWCIWSAPLYMSNDLGALRPEFAAILKNKHLIGVDQDPLGVLGLMSRQSANGKLQAFVKPLEPISSRTGCPSFAIVYLNRNTLGNHQKVSFKLADLLLGAPVRQAARNQAVVRAYELNGSSDVRALQSASQELDQLLGGGGRSDALVDSSSSYPTGQRQSDAIDANGCLKRLRQAGEFKPPNQQEVGRAPSGKRKKIETPLEFELFDLFEDGKSLGSLGAHENLELLVDPSSVRAIKLVEKS